MLQILENSLQNYVKTAVIHSVCVKNGRMVEKKDESNWELGIRNCAECLSKNQITNYQSLIPFYDTTNYKFLITFYI